MADEETTIGATFWIIADQPEVHDWAGSLEQRLESDGRDVEKISVEDFREDLGLSDLAPEKQIRVVCYLVIRLQKHGVVPIVSWSGADPDLVAIAEEELEQEGLFVAGRHPVSYSGARTIEDGESFTDVAMEVADQRGLFEEALSDQRSEEEVTDRLKNLGYI